MGNKYMAICVPGAEAILKEEIDELIPERNNIYIKRGKVFFDSVSELDKMMRLKCADNIYKLLCRFDVGLHKEDLKTFYKKIVHINISDIFSNMNKYNTNQKYKIIVSASRSGKHTYSRYDLSDAATDALLSINHFILGDEKEHDIAFRIDVNDNACIFSMQLTSSEFKFRGSDFHSSKGGIRPTIAHYLVRISCPKNNDIFYDPFCGAGTIPYERAMYKYKKIFASDIDDEVIDIARSNLSNDVILFKSDAVDTSIKSGSIDTVVTNMPWGKQIVITDIDRLYDDFIKELKRILKAEGKAVILTDQYEPLNNACNRWGVVLNRITDFSLHGLHPSVYIIVKNSTYNNEDDKIC